MHKLTLSIFLVVCVLRSTHGNILVLCRLAWKEHHILFHSQRKLPCASLGYHMTFCCFNSYLLLIVQKWFFARPIIDPVEVNKYHVFSVHFYLEISPSAYVSVALSRFGEMNSQTNIVKIPIYSTIQKNIRIIGKKEKTGFKGTAFSQKRNWVVIFATEKIHIRRAPCVAIGKI